MHPVMLKRKEIGQQNLSRLARYLHQPQAFCSLFQFAALFIASACFFQNQGVLQHCLLRFHNSQKPQPAILLSIGSFIQFTPDLMLTHHICPPLCWLQS